MKILLIEDDQEIVRSLTLALKEAGFVIDVAADGEQGRNLAIINNYDLVILDYNLPQLNGREVLKEIRRKKNKLPVMILTVRSEIDDKVELLNCGADDYLTKPFSLAELLARIRAILRRPTLLSDDILKIGTLRLNSNTLKTEYNNKNINLTNKEFSLLEYLMRNKGHVLSRQAIMESVWDINADPFSNTIEVHIMRLRQKLNNKNKLIFTYPGRGYKIDERR